MVSANNHIVKIFSIAIFANIANYLSSGGDSATWCNDWNKLGINNIKCN